MNVLLVLLCVFVKKSIKWVYFLNLSFFMGWAKSAAKFAVKFAKYNSKSATAAHRTSYLLKHGARVDKHGFVEGAKSSHSFWDWGKAAAPAGFAFAGVQAASDMGHKRKSSSKAPSTVKRGKYGMSKGSFKGKKLFPGRKRKRAPKGKGNNKRHKKADPFKDSNDQYSGDFLRKSIRIGRKISRRKLAQTLSIVDGNEAILRFQGVTAQSAAAGYFLIDRTMGGVPPANGSSEFVPAHFFNLSGLGSYSASGSGNNYVNWRAQKFWVTGGGNPDYTFYHTTGNSAAGVAATNNFYEVERADHLVTSGARDFLEWVQIKLLCIGPVSDHCKWRVSIVTFQEDYLAPDYSGFAASGVAGEALERLNRRNQMYDALHLPFISNPIMAGSKKPSKFGYKTLWSTTFGTQPKDKQDNLGTGEERLISIFKRVNKVQNYDWEMVGRPPAVVAGAEQYGWPVNVSSVTSQISNDVAPTKRMWLVVQAEVALGATAGNIPTFDLIIRKKHVSNY